MRDTEPYSQAYLKQCQYLHDLFWDPFDDPDDTSAICQNVIAFCRLIDPKLVGSVNETDGIITKQSLEQYIASEITDDRIFLLKKKRKYPIINKESIKFAMDNIDSVDKKDVREYVKNLNKFIEQYAYPYAITVDHPYAKYAPKKIILPVTMTEDSGITTSTTLYEEHQTDDSPAYQEDQPESKTPYVHRVEYNFYDPNLMDLKKLPSDEESDSVTEPS